MSGIQRWECRVATNTNGRPYVDDIEYAAGRYVLHSDHEAEVGRLTEEIDGSERLIRLLTDKDEAMEAEVARLRAELEAYQEDAERYRWLRDQHASEGRSFHVREPNSEVVSRNLDFAIDAAMGADA